ncbi:hypothetical protein HDV05_002628, partial [Chytridiales sp. JEL 0842]
MSRQNGFGKLLQNHLNRYTLYFHPQELEAAFQLYVRPWLAKTISFHHQVGFIGSIAIFVIECVLLGLFDTTKGYASLLISATYAVFAACLWRIRVIWERKFKKVQSSPSDKEDNKPPQFVGERGSKLLMDTNAIEQLSLWLVKLVSEGTKGYIVSITTYTVYIALMIWMSSISERTHASEALIYMNIIYVSCLDSTDISYVLTDAALILTSLALTLEMLFLGKGGIYAFARLGATVIVVGVVTYVHIIQAKAAFIMQAVLDYSQTQLDK